MRGIFFLVDARSWRMILPRIQPPFGSNNLCNEVKPQSTDRGLPQRGNNNRFSSEVATLKLSKLEFANEGFSNEESSNEEFSI